MKIDDSFRIEKDTYNVTLVHEVEGEVNKKTGKPTITKHQWHYPSIEMALKKYLTYSIEKNLPINFDVKVILDTISECMIKIENLNK